MSSRDPSDLLRFAHQLADVADRVSSAHFRSHDLRRIYKTDGTPVAVVDREVEDTMLAIVRAERPDDAVLGEEVGAHPGTSGVRWIWDGVDGTFNYAEGREGWSTIVAAEVDGEVVAGVVTAPVWGTRWWATLGGGAWSAPNSPNDPPAFDEAERVHCRPLADIDNPAVMMSPFKGFQTGWRDAVTALYTPPVEPRMQCFSHEAMMVADGRIDGLVILYGGIWDVAAPQLIVREAGGVYRDAWGGNRLDTATGVFTTAAFLERLLEGVARYRPDVPDEPIVARTVSVPIGSPDEQALDAWRAFGLRPMPTMSARTRVVTAPQEVLNIVDDRAAELRDPFIGVTTNGVPRRIDRDRPVRKVDTAPITDAALALLQSLSAEQRTRVGFDLDAVEWRMWINVHMNHFRHGLLLEDLHPTQRDLALGMLRSTLSARGYAQARSIIRLNQLLADIGGDKEAFGEWAYFVSIFGTPGNGAPWGWQIDGHHLCINTVVFDDRIVMTPSFMGSEPRRVSSGPYAGISLFDSEESLGLDLIRSFDTAQRDQAILYPSIHPDDIPPALQNLFDGRMAAGAFHDNLIAPYQGVAGSDMSESQRKIMTSLAAAYTGWSGDDHAEVRLDEVERHLDETWFSWYGGYDDVAPFYYRVHSPVILIEFDHHPGIVLDNEVPTRFHVHTVVRTPNGGDYGVDLLRQHHERFDHHTGHHEPRDASH